MQKSKIYNLILFIICISLCSCANELPPSGGDEDVSPPVVLKITPKANTVNFSGKSIVIEFDEYVDRRSFQDALFISPKPKSDVELNYSGREVEIFFPDGLDANKTYTIYLGKDLKDVRRGNKLSEPIQFAISTGSKIDKGKLFGKVYSDKYEDLFITAYNLNSISSPNPEKDIADYISQVDAEGNYSFLNLPEGKFRVFAMKDNNRDLLFDKEFDKIYMTTGDVEVSDTKEIKNIDFLAEDFGIVTGSEEFYSLLKPDTAKIIYSSIFDYSKEVAADNRFYFYFPNNKLSKLDIADNITIRDTASGELYKPVFNWVNDSLLELFSPQGFKPGSSLKVDFNLTNTSLKYYYTLRFSIAEESSVGKISGRVTNLSFPGQPVWVKLFNNNNKFITYSAKIYSDTSFTFPSVMEGTYTLFSFVDSNDDGEFFYGEAYPFKPSEKFIVYSQDMKVRGTWSVDNVFLNF